MSDWIQTYTGRKFYPLRPDPAQIDIRDIAHSLAMQCRFGGHCVQFYSVAEHSVHVAGVVPVEDRAHALLHDAAEAYLMDLPRPIKRVMPGYGRYEKSLQNAILAKFGLTRRMPRSVVAADAWILNAEAEFNMNHCEETWHSPEAVGGVTLEYWDPVRAERTYLETYSRIFGGVYRIV